MSGRTSARKGSRAELEAAKLLADLTGYPVRRKLGAGRTDDTGDLDGIPDTTIQIRNYQNITRAVTSARDDAEQQARNAGTPFRAGMVRHPGGTWTVVMTPEAFCCLLREAL